MSGHRPWRELRGEADRDPARRQRLADARRAAETEQELYAQSLAELRRARAFTQAQLADALGAPQSQISRIEHQTELYISTLARYLEAMGGRLELVGVFDGQRVLLSLGDLIEDLKQEDSAQESVSDLANAASART